MSNKEHRIWVGYKGKQMEGRAVFTSAMPFLTIPLSEIKAHIPEGCEITCFGSVAEGESCAPWQHAMRKCEDCNASKFGAVNSSCDNCGGVCK